MPIRMTAIQLVKSLDLTGTLVKRSPNYYSFFHSGALLQAVVRMSNKASTISTCSDLVNKVTACKFSGILGLARKIYMLCLH